ncbi:hypothetical protein CYMTET_40233 [Cymbomonas tetramitiformis]|uniref:C3H1-type domain-containing protein n=1 Tax=Cymbomonas tetramitiformis TaxID=36881 RepID=A0AAE0F4T7_9CHLO|nr:hypothetical protein CYMTET_40233 [Cymbomonas tetramitiformis]
MVVSPEIPQASLSGSRRTGKDRRDAESEGEAAEEEQVDEDLFGKDEEDAEKARKLKKSVAVPRLSKDQFLEQNFEMVEKISDLKERALFRKYISWILTLTEKFSWVDVYDFDAQVRNDFALGRVTTWDPVPFAFRFQYSFADSLGEAQKRRTDDRGGKKSNPRDSKTRDKKRDGVCDSFQTARGCKKGKDCGFVHACPPLDPGLTAGMARDEVKAKKVKKAKFSGNVHGCGSIFGFLWRAGGRLAAIPARRGSSGMVRTDAGSVPGISAFGIVFRVVEGVRSGLGGSGIVLGRDGPDFQDAAE